MKAAERPRSTIYSITGLLAFLFVLLVLILPAGAEARSMQTPSAAPTSRSVLRPAPQSRTSHAAKPAPFLLKGSIANMPNDTLVLEYTDATGLHYEKLPTDENGRFSFVSRKINSPVTAELFIQRMFTDLYIAPGYRLDFSCDISDIKKFYASKTINGPGAPVNRYLFARDALLYEKRDTLDSSVLGDEAFLRFAQHNKKLRDSVFHKTFDRNTAKDRWFNQFARISEMDNQFMLLYYLVGHVIDHKEMNYRRSVSYVTDHFDHAILANLYKTDYFRSNIYRTWLMSDYALYLRTLDCRKDPNDCDDKMFTVEVIERIDRHYKGPIKEKILTGKINGALRNCGSFEEWTAYHNTLPAYIHKLSNPYTRAALDTLLMVKGEQLLKTQAGKNAPAFIAKDSTGRTYTLDDFKGKVVYLDLWTSWCAPCRQLNPRFQDLYNKFKDDDRIACVSVAVWDKLEKWKTALREEKPASLQLIDENGSVGGAYVAHSVPKFILINKRGKIVTFSAPLPDTEEIERILKQEIEN